MSYNITAIDILTSEGFAIPRTLWRALALPTSGAMVDAPDGSFLNPNWAQSAATEKQAFLDAAAVQLMVGLTDPPERERFAREAYETAEILWNERRRRLQGVTGG